MVHSHWPFPKILFVWLKLPQQPLLLFQRNRISIWVLRNLFEICNIVAFGVDVISGVKNLFNVLLLRKCGSLYARSMIFAYIPWEAKRGHLRKLIYLSLVLAFSRIRKTERVSFDILSLLVLLIIALLEWLRVLKHWEISLWWFINISINREHIRLFSTHHLRSFQEIG